VTSWLDEPTGPGWWWYWEPRDDDGSLELVFVSPHIPGPDYLVSSVFFGSRFATKMPGLWYPEQPNAPEPPAP